MSDTLQNLKEYITKMNQYEHVVTLLNWDMETVMPKLGFDGHALAMTYFSTEMFKVPQQKNWAICWKSYPDRKSLISWMICGSLL